MLEILQLPVLTDNYIYLIHEPDSGDTAVVDPALAEPVLAALASKGWQLTHILNTHHHWDHVGANLELKQHTACKIIGAANDKHRIPGIDIDVREHDKISLGAERAEVIETPGHTSGHIVYYFADSQALFCGDTVFVMGCGRLFEGTADQMWNSLQKLRALPGETRIYCAHEYTQTNGRFALSIEPENIELQEKMRHVDELRAKNQSTVPSTIGEELSTNPFFRSNSLALQTNIKLAGHTPVEVFAKTRELKDNF